MNNKISAFVLIAFSFLLPFGSFDPVFGVSPVFGLIDLFSLLLVLYGLVFRFNFLIKKIDLNVIYLLLLVFFLFFSSVIYGHSEYQKSIFNFKLLILILIYIILCLQFNNSPASIHYSLLAFSLGAFVYVLLLGTVYSYGLVENKGRLWVFGENPNSTSARLSLAVIFFIYILIYNPFKSFFIRYIAFIMSIPIVYVIVQSGSRGSFVSMVFSCIILLYFSRLKFKYKVFITFILIMVFPFAIDFLLSTGSIAERFSETVAEGGLGARELIWGAVLKIIISSPILGVGEPGYFEEMRKLTGVAIDPHNLFLYILASGGIVSFLVFCLFFFRLVLHSYDFLKKKDVLPFVLLLNITLIAFKTGGVLTYSIMWFVFSIVASYQYPHIQKNVNK